MERAAENASPPDKQTCVKWLQCRCHWDSVEVDLFSPITPGALPRYFKWQTWQQMPGWSGMIWKHLRYFTFELWIWGWLWKGKKKRKEKRNLSKVRVVLIFLLLADNYLNPDSNIYFAVPHIGGFQGSSLHSPYVHWVVYRFRCSASFGGAQNGGLFIRAAAVPVVCCYIFRLSTVTTAPISAIVVVLFSLSF